MPTFRHTVLPNGLVVVAETDPLAHSAAAGFFVRTGARDETSELMGVSHFLEHMMFKGSERIGGEAVNAAFDDLGVQHNAFTTSETTAFWAHGLPESLAPSIDVLAEILRPALREADLEEERKVILEEIAMTDDQPFWVLYERAMEEHYGEHPLGHRILGTPETVSSISRDAMREYLDRRYTTGSTVVALAGRLDFDATVAQIAARTANWPQGTLPVRRSPQPRGGCEVDLALPSTSRNYLMLTMRFPSAQDPRRHAAAAIAEILGDVEGSRLYWGLVDPGLAEEAQCFHDARDGDGLLIVSIACPPEGAPSVRERTREILDEFESSLVDDDLARVRSKIATAITLAGERPGGRMQRLGSVWTALGRYESLEEDLARIDALTLDDLRETLHEFPLVPCVTASLHP